MVSDTRVTLAVDGLQALLRVLENQGYRVVGPTVHDGAIVYDDIATLADLPKGWTDEQDGGHYRLVRRDDDKLFGYAVGPESWKKFLHPPVLRLWHSRQEGEKIGVTPERMADKRFAFIGVRACELSAIAIQDRVFLGGPHADPHYAQRREGAFIVAVNCSNAGGTCFCVSMNTGPEATSGFDLALTEVDDKGKSLFVVSIGSRAGRGVLEELPARAATPVEESAADDVIARTAQSMGREMRSDGVRDLLMENFKHPRWDDVAERCLTCGNCTMVCPTCFCTSVDHSNDLASADSSCARRWDSCFTKEFSFIHGGSIRPSARARYRQWITHKLATWIDQFGTSGCVGCGRCITWCPVGIDITEEVRAIRDSQPATGDHHGNQEPEAGRR